MKSKVIRYVVSITAALSLIVAGHAFAEFKKMAICHKTGSETNPYVYIIVSASSFDRHSYHKGDLIPAPNPECNPGGGQA